MIDFVGNVEGNDLVRGMADVIVCEGYVGNVVLKLLEGVSEVLDDVAQAAAERKLVWRVGLRLLSQGIERVHALTDFSRYGGSPILGFDRLFIKCHGRSRARAVGNAVKVAAKAVRDRVPAEIADAIGGGALTLLRRRSRAPDVAAAAALPLGSRQDLPAQRVRHAAPALDAPRASGARTRSTVPGVTEVLKGLRAAADRRGRPAAIHFISASPPQIGQAIRDKLALDGVPVRRHRLQGPAPAPAARQVPQPARARRLQAGRAVPRAQRARRVHRASCSSATTGNRTRSRTRSTPTSWTVR